MKKLMILAAVVAALSGCTSSASRMADCEAQGVSRDTCYLAEQNRKAAITGAAEGAALRNAADVVQKGQAAKKFKPFTKHFQGMTIKYTRDGFLSLDGNLAALDEDNADAKVFSSGLWSIVVYKSGKVAMMKEGRLEGYAK